MGLAPRPRRRPDSAPDIAIMAALVLLCGTPLVVGVN